MRRLLASSQLPQHLQTSLKNPELFYPACDTVRLLSGLGFGWDYIKNKLINRFNPYTYAHPDLEIIQTVMGIQQGRDLK